MSIDLLIDATLQAATDLPPTYNIFLRQIKELKYRLSKGKLNLAVVGEFNRGKSTFINAIIGSKILPTSVLPVTSIPTKIVYGETPSCIVRFLKNKPDLIVTQSKEKIVETLIQYATEQKNPKNQFSVSSIEVQYPSRILENGTVLIDTPGFGSAHIHNTMLALESLTECDAVIFLLSAESPLTHTELEFLKLLISKIPRIFFVLNKVDLLNNSQLREVDIFIKKILEKYLSPKKDVYLFPVSALLAEKSITTSDSTKLWAMSGMEKIEKDILLFMSREKYFTLAMALSDKLREAVKGMVALLQKEKSELESPLFILSKEESEITKAFDTLTNSLTEVDSYLTIEKNNLLESIRNNLPKYEDRIKSKIIEALELLIKPSKCDKEALKNAAISLNCISEQILSTFRKDILFNINTSLKNIFAAHSRKSEEILKLFLRKISQGEKDDVDIWTKINKIEIRDLFERELTEKTINKIELKLDLKWYDWFLDREKRIKKIQEKFNRKENEKINRYLEKIFDALISSMEETFENARKIVIQEYERVLKIFKSTSEKKRDAILKEREKVDISLKNIELRIDLLNKILAKIR